jgi:hypothetical protein
MNELHLTWPLAWADKGRAVPSMQKPRSDSRRSSMEQTRSHSFSDWLDSPLARHMHAVDSADALNVDTLTFPVEKRAAVLPTDQYRATGTIDTASDSFSWRRDTRCVLEPSRQDGSWVFNAPPLCCGLGAPSNRERGKRPIGSEPSGRSRRHAGTSGISHSIAPSHALQKRRLWLG